MSNNNFLETYGPTAVVTGASSGIGESFASRLAALGFDLVLIARREDRLLATAQALQAAHHIDVHVIGADLSSAADLERVITKTAELDVGLLVSNAGFGLKGKHQDNDAQQLSQMLMLNCQAPMQLTHAFIPRLLERGRGGILLTSSIEGFLGFPNSSAYAASKAFVNSLAEGLWGELSPQGIDVLALCPGSTDTEAHALQGIDQSTLVDMMSPDEVATLALENLPNGPTYISGESNQQMIQAMTQMPRKEALMALGVAIEQSLLVD